MLRLPCRHASTARPARQGSRIVSSRGPSTPSSSPKGPRPTASSYPKSNYLPTLRPARDQQSFAPPEVEPGDVNDPFVKSLQQLQRNLESQKAEIADELAEVVRTPEWKAYDREVETEIARLEDAWMRSPKAVTKESVADLQSAVSAKVDELTAKYQDRMDERDEHARTFPQLLDDELKRNWAKLMKELGPPPAPVSPLTAEEFECAFAEMLAPGQPQPLAPSAAKSIESPAASSAEALNELNELLAPVTASNISTRGPDGKV